MNESFWDAQNVEIEACAIFESFRRSSNILEIFENLTIFEKIEDPMHWVRTTEPNRSMAQMLAAASIWAIDALFGLVARNDAEWHRRELLGRTWRRDWGMRIVRHLFTDRAKISGRKKNCPIRCSGFMRF